MIHQVKCINPFFEDVMAGRKTFEIRKNDRDYKVGDLMILREYSLEREKYMGRRYLVEITYIYEGSKHGKFGLHKGFVILGVRNFEDPTGQIPLSGKR